MKCFKEIFINTLVVLGIIIFATGIFYVGALCAAFDIEMMIRVSPWFGLAFLPFPIALIFVIADAKDKYRKKIQ